MLAVLTPDQMKKADRLTIERGTPAIELMRRAGFAVAREAVRLGGAAYGRTIVLVCGRGNNGGDGFIAAKQLRAMGAFPVVVLLHSESDLGGDSAVAFEHMRGVATQRFSPALMQKLLKRSDLVVDAIVGTGFSGALRGAAAEAVGLINQVRVPVLAVDLPSGVNGADGSVDGIAVSADVTVTFGAKKPGLLLLPGAGHAGKVVVAGIGIDVASAESKWVEPEASDVVRLFPRRDLAAHKRRRGKVLVVAGSAGMSGAAVLASRGAIRAGSGLVRVAVPEPIASLVAGAVPEALVGGVAATPRGTFDAAALPDVMEMADAVDAVVAGPGVRRDPETREFVEKLLSEIRLPVVLDADGVSIFASEPEVLRGRSAPTLITPHSGELGRLLGRDPDEIDQRRLDWVTRASEATGATVLLKGYRTLVADPSGSLAVITTGGPSLATAGTGDVLAGVAGALIGRLPPFEAGWGASWLHGKAGDTLAEMQGEHGAAASDLLHLIPRVIREIQP